MYCNNDNIFPYQSWMLCCFFLGLHRYLNLTMTSLSPIWFIWNDKRNIIDVSMESSTSCCWCHPWLSPPCLLLLPVLRDCGMVGNLKPSVEGYEGWVFAHVSCWGAQTVRHIRQLPCHVPIPQDSSSPPETKIILPQEEVKTVEACAVRESPKYYWACENCETLSHQVVFMAFQANLCQTNPLNNMG